jgi:hypothetical protein
MLVTNDAKICQEIHEHCTERKIRGKVFMKFTSHSSTEVGRVRTYVSGARVYLFRQLQPEVSMVDTSELIVCSSIIFIWARYVVGTVLVGFILNVNSSAEFLTVELYSLHAADLLDLFNPKVSKLCTY